MGRAGLSGKRLYVLVAGLAVALAVAASAYMQTRGGPSVQENFQEEGASGGLSLEVSGLGGSRVDARITNNAGQGLSNVYLFVDGVLKTGGPIASPLASGHTTSAGFDVGEGAHEFFANSTEGFESGVVGYP